MVPVIGGSVALGLGESAESINDTALNFEVDRMDVNLVTYDFVNNKLIFKAQISEQYEGKIYEVGLFSKIAETTNDSRMITTFDSATENWLVAGAPAPFQTQNARIGSDSMSLTPSASGFSSAYISDISIDLSNSLDSDIFSFAFFVSGANTSSIRYRFITDNGNYYDFNLGSQTAGYKVVQVPRSFANTTGNPNWGSINSIEVTVIAGSGGAARVDFDGVRVNNAINDDTDLVMVSRELLSTPFTKVAGMVQEVEFSLDVNV